MFEKTRLKFYSFWIGSKKPKAEGFVNPYPSRIKIEPGAANRLNPYVVTYDTKKKKSFVDLIFKKKQERELPGRRIPLVDVVEIPKEPIGPTFFEDTIRVASGDVVYFATACRAIIPHALALLPKKPEPRIISGDDIRRTCENLRW